MVRVSRLGTPYLVNGDMIEPIGSGLYLMRAMYVSSAPQNIQNIFSDVNLLMPTNDHDVTNNG